MVSSTLSAWMRLTQYKKIAMTFSKETKPTFLKYWNLFCVLLGHFLSVLFYFINWYVEVSGTSQRTTTSFYWVLYDLGHYIATTYL